MSVRILPEAQREVVLAAEWFESRRPGLGDDFAAEFQNAVRIIAEQPDRHGRGRVRGTSREFRRSLIDRFSYKIGYEVIGKHAVVVPVAHTSRRPNYWKHRL